MCSNLFPGPDPDSALLARQLVNLHVRVTVRAGRDVYTVTHCEDMHLLEWIELADDVLEVYIEPGYMH
ncbi:hypothetical protein DPMN_133231 [Dreissena polymorpha]|uniref:Uncharacterized protein n=1 Tax=Dreissena polymorpha TaxID=45954 RepID=A0A9D4FTY0_DREPO|nr:hypothetical protein DPMN_133231 [Dreissena polymorpha]